MVLILRPEAQGDHVMRYSGAIIGFLALTAWPSEAQDRGRRGASVPPGHLPPPGECRVWYDARPPGHQPPPTSCREAERIASRDRYARVIYGDDRPRRDIYKGRERDPRDERWEDRRDNDRAVPRRDRSGRYPSSRDRSSNGDRYPGAYLSVPFANGYQDGYDKGREDARARRSHEVDRHRQFRSADRGYDRRYGTRDEYRVAYREGFGEGYEEGYRGLHGARDGERPGRVRRPPMND